MANYQITENNTRTAKEMSLESHNLSKCGKYARCVDSLWLWTDYCWTQIDGNNFGNYKLFRYDGILIVRLTDISLSEAVEIAYRENVDSPESKKIAYVTKETIDQFELGVKITNGFTTQLNLLD